MYNHGVGGTDGSSRLRAVFEGHSKILHRVIDAGKELLMGPPSGNEYIYGRTAAPCNRQLHAVLVLRVERSRQEEIGFHSFEENTSQETRGRRGYAFQGRGARCGYELI